MVQAVLASEVGMPLATVETPAPPKNTTRLAHLTLSASSWAASRASEITFAPDMAYSLDEWVEEQFRC